ncbi:IPT/TIG domain-containing protein [Candidatus Daviesbacteria bacterium]|nr:IPT/TIG domain-containing protein [Candidatus Daviesbacteria bacterium]
MDRRFEYGSAALAAIVATAAIYLAVENKKPSVPPVATRTPVVATATPEPTPTLISAVPPVSSEYVRCRSAEYAEVVNIGADGRHMLQPYLRQEASCNNSRQVLQPVIESVDPLVARPGDWVVIKGENFLQEGAQPTYLQVWLPHKDGGVGLLASVVPSSDIKLEPPIWTPNEIRFRVPNIPAQSGKVTVITGGGYNNGKGTSFPPEFTVKPR